MLERPPQNKFSVSKLDNRYFEEDVRTLQKEINEQYLYWDMVKYQPLPQDINAEKLWGLIKFRRKSIANYIQISDHHFSWNTTNIIQKSLHTLDMQCGGALQSAHLIPSENKEHYLISSIMEEAIASSQIEGAVTTRKHAKEMLRKNLPPRNTSDKMILNNYRTMQEIKRIQHLPITEERLLNIHRLMTNETLDHYSDEGAFRKDDSVTVFDHNRQEVVWQPPACSAIPEMMTAFYAFFNDENKEEDAYFTHPVIKACIIHFLTGYIHPFADGNGRTARALMHWYLLKKGYWLSEYLSISRMILKTKDAYAKAYQRAEADENDVTYFIQYQLRTMMSAFEELKNYLARKQEEKKQINAFVRISGINQRQGSILKSFYEEPNLMVTARDLQSKMGVTAVTIRADLQALVAAGYLQIVGLNKKTQSYVRSDDFQSLLQNPLQNLP